MTIQSFNKQNCKALIAEINEALDVIAKKHGIFLTVGGGRFTHDTFTTKLNAIAPQTVQTAFVVTEKPEVKDWTGALAPAEQTVTPVTGEQALAKAPFGPAHKWTIAFVKSASFYGFTVSDLGTEITYQGRKWRIGGFTSNSPRGNIILATMGLKPRYMPVKHTHVLAALGR